MWLCLCCKGVASLVVHITSKDIARVANGKGVSSNYAAC